MSFSFRPARMEQAGLFVSLAGGTNSGKSYSGLRLARGIAGPNGKIAALDTEAGRLSHYSSDFAFDVFNMQPPFRPERFAQAALAAEEAGYAAFLIDSFTMEWVGPGGVLDWQAEEFKRMGSKEASRLKSWIAPKMAHKAMVYSFLQRRIPLIFAMRAEEKVEKNGSDINKWWAPICNKAFPFELTVSFMLATGNKGHVDLSDPKSWKMEKAHRDIFHDGDLISEEHGAQLAAWARGEGVNATPARDRNTIVAEELITRFEATESADEHEAIASDPEIRKRLTWFREKKPDLFERINAAFAASFARHEAPDAPPSFAPADQADEQVLA